MYTRRSAWAGKGKSDWPWSSDLLWYAKGVGLLQARPFADPTSWWSYAAIHGFREARWRAVRMMPTTPPPGAGVQKLLWDQCQHQTWYFVPWHRGYVGSIEAELRAAVVAAGGPKDWALPYWNYFKDPDIPPAFMQQQLPGGQANPLYVAARFGPDGNGVVRVAPEKINAKVMDLVPFTGAATGGSPGFGGVDTGFSHRGQVLGALENQPHNVVHGLVGGRGPLGGTLIAGAMSDPDTAALDPIFWLHHANIDRMWAAWNAAGRKNPESQPWLDGPTDRQFALPSPSGKIVTLRPRDVSRLGDLDYTYDSLDVGAPVPSAELQQVAGTGGGGGPVAMEDHVELVGASAGPLALERDGASGTVRLEPTVEAVADGLVSAQTNAGTSDHLFLNLEGVRSRMDAIVLDVYVGLPARAVPDDRPDLLAGTVGLFGTRAASDPDGPHGGQGITHVLDVTDVVAGLRRAGELDLEELSVSLVPTAPLEPDDDVSVARISLFRQGQARGSVS